MQPIRRWSKTALVTAVSLLLLTGCGQKYPVLDPQGPVGKQELGLIEWSGGLMTVMVLIVFVIFAWIAFKWRARSNNADYIPPEQEGNKLLETIWTIIPIIIVVAIAIPTVIVTYRLQKQPTPATNKQTVVIDVASANWKWLFSYPQQGIETVNHLEIPAGSPVDFQLTAIGPMNSFWVPALGGMEMDMPGEDLGLWLQANHPGTYEGRSANFSGKGFTHMTFNVKAVSQAQFNQWVNQVKQNDKPLTTKEYNNLLKPGLVGTMTFSSAINPNAYNGSTTMTQGAEAGKVPAAKTSGSGSSNSSDSMAGMNMGS